MDIKKAETSLVILLSDTPQCINIETDQINLLADKSIHTQMWILIQQS